MANMRWVLTLFLCAWPWLIAQAQETGKATAPSSGNAPVVAVIDVSQVVAESLMGQKFTREIQQFRQQQSQELQKLQQELQNLQKRYEEQASVLSEEALIDLRSRARQKSREIDRFREDADAEINERRQAFLERLEQELRPIIGQFCQEKGIDLVFDTQFVVFARRTLDITRDIIQRFNQKFQQSQGKSR